MSLQLLQNTKIIKQTDVRYYFEKSEENTDLSHIYLAARFCSHMILGINDFGKGQ